MLNKASSSVSLNIQCFFSTSYKCCVSDISFGSIERNFVFNDKACKLSCARPILNVLLRVHKIPKLFFSRSFTVVCANLVNSCTKSWLCCVMELRFL